MRRSVMVGSFLVLLTACGSDPAEEIQSLPACEHFDNVASDVRAGVLTAPELRARLQQIDNDARLAPDDVKLAAEAMLRAITQNDGPGLIAAGMQMDAACSAHGHTGASEG
jgi:hypothetical protein